AELNAGSNATGQDLLLKAVTVSSPTSTDSTQKVVNAVQITAVTPDNKVVDRFQFSKPELHVAVRYGENNQNLSGTSLAVPKDALQPDDVGMYWFNGQKYVKLYGKVDSG